MFILVHVLMLCPYSFIHLCYYKMLCYASEREKMKMMQWTWCKISVFFFLHAIYSKRLTVCTQLTWVNLDCLSRQGLTVMYTWLRCVTGTYLIASPSNFHSVVKSKQVKRLDFIREVEAFSIFIIVCYLFL